MDSPDDILRPIAQRLRQFVAAVRAAQSLADDWEGVANQQRAEIERLQAENERLRGIAAAACAYRAAVAVPDGVLAAEQSLFAALDGLDGDSNAKG